MNILSLENLWGTDHIAIATFLEAILENSDFRGRNKALVTEAHFLLCAVSSLKTYETKLLSQRADLQAALNIAGPTRVLLKTIPEAEGKNGADLLRDMVTSSTPQTIIHGQGDEEYTLETGHVPNDSLQIALAHSRRRIQSLETEILRVNHLIKSHYFTAKAKVIQALEVVKDGV